ncbi:MAG: hypothetical protein ACC656_11325, partial [Candidatus Heimdallarchaeota archaeon]
RHIHVISPTVGSVYQITQDIVNYLYNFHHITKEYTNDKPQIPKQLDILLIHFLQIQYVETEIFYQFKKRILIQPIDGTHIKRKFVNAMNQFDLIITPATAGKEILRKNGITVQIEVVPNYWNHEIYDYQQWPIPVDDNTFLFYHESYGQPRKRIARLCEGYLRAFSNSNLEKQKLIIKTCNDKSLNQHIAKFKKMYKNPANIEFITDFLPIQKLRWIWKRTNCYISLSGIEGFCIPMLNMSVLNKPIISIKNSIFGYMDFVDDTFLINSDMLCLENDNEIYNDTKNCWVDFPNYKYQYILQHVINTVDEIDTLNTDISKYEKYLKLNVMLTYKRLIEE